MGMAAIMFNAAEPLSKVSTSLRQKTPCESGENRASGFREEEVSRFHHFIRVNSTGARTDNLQRGGGTKF